LLTSLFAAYNLIPLDNVQQYLKALPQFDDTKLYSLSLKAEPRNAARADIH
jgi:hypothetical protein